MLRGHHFSPTIIREYDIRGKVGIDLNHHDALALGRVLGQILSGKNSGLAVVGRDGRHSSAGLSEELCHGLSLAGLNIMDIGVVATPTLYFANKVLNADLGVMVTGSHNGPEYNGFKMVVRGKPFFGKDLKRLAEIAKQGFASKINGTIVKTNVGEAYVNRILMGMELDPYKIKPLKVGWDPGNGALGPALSQVVKKLPGRHFIINEEIDGDFPAHHPDPTVAKNLVQLQALVAEKSLDIGFAFDGDGDRIGIVDALGRIIWGDQILSLLAAAILPLCPKDTPVLYDVKASAGLEQEILRLGGKPIMCPTGHSIIKSKMVEYNSPLAGEMSGHIFIGHNYYGYDDALYVALRLLDYLQKSRYSLVQLIDALPKFINTPEIRIDVDEAIKFGLISKIAKNLTHYKQEDICLIDGLRVKEEGGWWLIRASNTQACIVVRCEAETEQRLVEICQLVAGILEPLGVNTDEISLAIG